MNKLRMWGLGIGGKIKWIQGNFSGRWTNYVGGGVVQGPINRICGSCVGKVCGPFVT